MERIGFLTPGSSPTSADGARWVRDRGPGVVIAIALHVAALAWLLQFEAVRRPLAELAPIMVRLVAPPKAEVAPPPEPPKPKPVVRPPPRPAPKQVEPLPLITAPTEAPTAFAVPAAAPQPLPPIEAPPQVEAAPPIVPPRFNADYLRNPAPPYPAAARRMREEGRVVLRVLVAPDGRPDRVEVRTSSGSPRLDQSALETVRQWLFVPARQGDQPVAAWVLVPISFTLRG
jgi:protein TonB